MSRYFAAIIKFRIFKANTSAQVGTALATDALEAMGLSVSDAIRLLMIRIAEEHRLPFNVKVPNTCLQSGLSSTYQFILSVGS